MKDKYGQVLNKDDPVWFELPECSGRGKITQVNGRTCHVTCAGEKYKGLYSRHLTLWKDKNLS